MVLSKVILHYSRMAVATLRDRPRLKIPGTGPLIVAISILQTSYHDDIETNVRT